MIDASTPRGLTSAEAAARLRVHGPNVLVPKQRSAAILELLHAFADPMALMLLAAGVVYLLLGEVREGVVLLVALVPVLGVDVFLELRSRKALEKLASSVAPRSRVLRDGREVEIPTEEIVPGDAILLREGDVVRADGVTRDATNLALDESQLTGESEPQEKRALAGDHALPPPDAHAVWAGSLVVAGHGVGEVTTTGVRTRFGDIARLVAEAQTAPTPLQRKTSGLVRKLAVLALVVATAVFVLSFLRGAGAGPSFVVAVSVALASIPEEFPLVFTLFLSLGAWRLGKQAVLVRRLTSVETLGSTTVVCVDKTGTLTRGQFVLDELIPLGDATIRTLLEAAVLACEKQADDPMERAIVARAEHDGVDVTALRASHDLVRDHGFDAVGKHMSHAWQVAGGGLVVAAKGAMEGVLEHCDPADPVRAALEREHEELAGRGARVLAVAVRRAPSDAPSATRADDESELRVVGLLGFRDPLRPEVPAAVAECQAAGIEIKVITGDHALTAHAITDAAGIIHSHEDGFVSGTDLAKLDAAAFARTVARATVFARVLPAQKFAIVDALAHAGAVVAMTGDGINDAPALRRADIGIAMGRRGTDVARAAADLVLLEDDFGSLVATVREGRHIFANIRRAFLYLVGFHVPIVTLALVAPLIGIEAVLLPIHLVLLELVVHPVSALVFEAEPAPPDLMTCPPRDPHAPILPRRALALSVVTGVLLSVASFALYVWLLPGGAAHARSVAFAAVVLGALWLVFAERSDGRSWISRPHPRGARFWGIWLGVLVSLVLALTVPAVASVLDMTPLSLVDWAWALAAGTVCTVWRAFGTGSGVVAAPHRA